MDDLNTDVRQQLLHITALATDYCSTLQNALSLEREEFVKTVLSLLPQIYYNFLIIDQQVFALDESDYLPSYVDEDYYDSIRRQVENILGPDDSFLETFEEDMKYSDTPIGASIAECLADIFQPLYNFVSVVRESDGERLAEAYADCRENFVAYWSQTLCNVMRALNNIYFIQQ